MAGNINDFLELVPFAIQHSISFRAYRYLLSTLTRYCVELRHLCMFLLWMFLS